MPIEKGSKRVYFPKVIEARELLKEKALEIYNNQILIINGAIAKGDFESAAKANQFLLEHMPSEDGVKMLDTSIDKPIEVEGSKQPTIQIGFNLSGIGTPKQLEPMTPAEVIDVEPVKEPSEK